MANQSSIDPDEKSFGDQIYYNRKLYGSLAIAVALLLGVLFYSAHFSSANNEEANAEKAREEKERQVAQNAQQEARQEDPGNRWKDAPQRDASDYEVSREDESQLQGTAFGKGQRARDQASGSEQEQAQRKPRKKVEDENKNEPTPPRYADTYASKSGAGVNKQDGGQAGEQRPPSRLAQQQISEERLQRLQSSLNANPMVSGGSGGSQGAPVHQTRYSQGGSRRGSGPPSPIMSPEERQQQAMETFQNTLQTLRGQGGGQQNRGGQGPPSSQGPTIGAPETGQSQFQARSQQKSNTGTYIATAINEPVSEFEIKAGTVIPVVLMTDINTDLPGSIRAQVTRPVYDHQQRHLLIPGGTQLLGSYSSMIATGQSRALMAWERMIFPDGRSVKLPGLAAKDLGGATGVRDQVDRHLIRTLGMSVMLAGIGTGFQMAIPGRSQGTFTRDPSTQEVFSQQIAQELSRVATQKIKQQINLKPTLKVRRGMRLYVYFNRDLAFREPYTEEKNDFIRFHRPYDGLRRQRNVRRAAPLDPGPYHVNPHSNRGELFAPPRSQVDGQGRPSNGSASESSRGVGSPPRDPRRVENGSTIRMMQQGTPASEAARRAREERAEQKEETQSETISVD